MKTAEDLQITTTSWKKRGRSAMTNGEKWTVSLRCALTGEMQSFTWHDSIVNQQKGTHASVNDVLECLLEDAALSENIGDPDDLVSDGYVTLPSEANRLFAALRDNAAKLRTLLGPWYQAAVFEGEDDVHTTA